MTQTQHNVGAGEPGEGDGQPLCSRCLTPFEPGEHYCRKCGTAVGQLTPYIPFVNIRFNYGAFGGVWEKLWRRGQAGIFTKALCLMLIVVFAPIMFVGLPFRLWGKRRRRDAPSRGGGT